MALQPVTDAAFAPFVAAPGVAFVEFSAPWCAPCRRTDPIVEELATKVAGARFGKVDCDQSPATAAANGVLSMPTFMLFRDGSKVDQIVGAVPRPVLEAALARQGAKVR
jgi:thioredoxin 1